MCSKINCPSCNQPTWKGCGEHIEEALHDVAPSDRCSCPRSTAPASAFTGSRPSEPFGGTRAGSW